MNVSNITTQVSKIVGFIMTIAFSLVAFVHGQSCQLLPGWSPSTLADGQSRTGYQINEATYTQSCTSAAGVITCISGGLVNGNAFPYSSCIPHTWANCTTPTGANHLEYRTLYKANHNTYTESCQQLSQSLQCLNGVFTGGITPRLYTFINCTEQNRAQCIDIRTTPASYRDHGETVIGYAATSPTLGQTCQTLQRTLTCMNGTRSGGSQSSLFTGCTNPPSFTGCVNTWVSPAITVPHGSSLNAYTHPTSIGTGTCNDILKPLTCTNGMRVGNGTNQQVGLYSGCIQAGTLPCANIITGTGTVLHGSYATVFQHPIALESNNQSCSNRDIVVQCLNGTRSGYNSSLYTGCQNISSGSCLNNLSNQYIPHLQSIFIYTGSSPIAGFGCDSVKMAVTCNAGVRHQFTGLGPVIGSSFPSTYFATCAGCITPRGTTVASGRSQYAFSVTGTTLPQSCNQFSALLSCNGNTLNGNRQKYIYPTCTGESLVPGIDIAIDESPGLSATSNLIAQGSSPEVQIIFKNKGDTSLIRSNVAAGFLKCARDEQDLVVYQSRVLSSFVVNSGTKVGVNIRIAPIFSQSLGQKTLTCTIYPSAAAYTDANTNNNKRTTTVEVVEARRFDLALSRSIEPISKNLEAAEGAVGTQGLQNFLFDKIMNVLVPLIVIIGILSAILGFYKLMFSSDENAVKEGTRYIVFGIIGIIVIMSAKFIGQNIYDILNPPTGEILGGSIAEKLYNNIVYPFIKFAIYLVLGAMFIILVGRVITFIFGSDADAQKKAGTLIGWNVISMLLIIAAKQIVQAIYGKQQDVVKDVTNLGEIGSGVLADKNIPILYQVINYALGIASLVILIIIIIQTIKLLTKPDDPAQVKNIKNSLLYMFIGILVLGAGYLIVNFAIIN